MKTINYMTLTRERMAMEQEALAEANRSQAAFTTVDDLIEMTTPENKMPEELDRIAQEADDALAGLVVMQNIVEANDQIVGEPNRVEMEMARVAMESAMWRLGMEDSALTVYGEKNKYEQGDPAEEKKKHAGMLATIKSYIQRGIEIIIAALKRVKDWFVDFADNLFGEATGLKKKAEALGERFKKLSSVWGEYDDKPVDGTVFSVGELRSVGAMDTEFDLKKAGNAVTQIEHLSGRYHTVSTLITGMGNAVSEGDVGMTDSFLKKIAELLVKDAEVFKPRLGSDMYNAGNRNLGDGDYHGYELVGSSFLYFPEFDENTTKELKEHLAPTSKDVTEGRSSDADIHKSIQLLRKFALRGFSKYNWIGKRIVEESGGTLRVFGSKAVSDIINLVSTSAGNLVGARGLAREATKTADKLLAEAQKQRAQLAREVEKDDEALKAMHGRVSNLVAFNSAVTYTVFQSIRDIDGVAIGILKAAYRLAQANVVAVEKMSAGAAA